MRKFFEFQNAAKIICGESALATIGKELSHLGAVKPLLLTSANAAKLGVKEKVIEALSNEHSGETVVADVVPPVVDIEYARAQKQVYLTEKCDALIAVGGDVAMDTAKVIKLLLSQDWDEILPIAQESIIKGKDVPLLCIPSENGSGKEANGYVEMGEYYLSTPALTPNVVIIDEDAAMAAPTREIAACGAYALANAVEAYIESDETEIAGVYAEKAVRVLAKFLIKAVRDGDDEEACRAVALASTLSGVAYGAKPYGAAHALAEGLNQVTGEPLEEMFALAMVPALIRAKGRHEQKVKDLYFMMVGAEEFAETPASERAEKAISSVEGLLEQLRELSGIPTKISETKIARELFGKIADAAVDKRASITANGPIEKDEFLSMLNQAY